MGTTPPLWLSISRTPDRAADRDRRGDDRRRHLRRGGQRRRLAEDRRDARSAADGGRAGAAARREAGEEVAEARGQDRRREDREAADRLGQHRAAQAAALGAADQVGARGEVELVRIQAVARVAAARRLVVAGDRREHAAARAVEQRVDRRHRRVERRRDLRHAEARPLAQHEGVPLLRRQGGDGRHHVADGALGLERAVDRGAVVGPLEVAVEDHRAVAPLGDAPDALVVRDPEEPRARLAHLRAAGQGGVGAREGRLGGVLRVLARAQRVQRVAVDRAAVRAIQLRRLAARRLAPSILRDRGHGLTIPGLRRRRRHSRGPTHRRGRRRRGRPRHARDRRRPGRPRHRPPRSSPGLACASSRPRPRWRCRCWPACSRARTFGRSSVVVAPPVVVSGAVVPSVVPSCRSCRRPSSRSSCGPRPWSNRRPSPRWRPRTGPAPGRGGPAPARPRPPGSSVVARLAPRLVREP